MKVKKRKDTTIPVLKSTKRKLEAKKTRSERTFDEVINLMLEGC